MLGSLIRTKVLFPNFLVSEEKRAVIAIKGVGDPVGMVKLLTSSVTVLSTNSKG